VRFASTGGNQRGREAFGCGGVAEEVDVALDDVELSRSVKDALVALVGEGGLKGEVGYVGLLVPWYFSTS